MEGMEVPSNLDQLRTGIDGDVDGSEPTAEDVKEIFVQFGMAYYHAEVLFRGLCNLYCLSQAPRSAPVTKPRLEEHIRTASELTLGQLLARFEKMLPPSLLDRLDEGLKRRNFIAHHFWFERNHLSRTVSGIEAILTELAQDSELFEGLDREVERLTDQLYPRLGLSPELLVTLLDEIRCGRAEGLDPLPSQRLPKKLETVVNVFNVPTLGGLSVLVFLTDDGLLWQLCDAGLGWSPYGQMDPSWPVAHEFNGLLPAKINPRPKSSASWVFNISFGALAMLEVYREGDTGPVVYRLRRTDI